MISFFQNPRLIINRITHDVEREKKRSDVGDFNAVICGDTKIGMIKKNKKMLEFQRFLP